MSNLEKVNPVRILHLNGKDYKFTLRMHGLSQFEKLTGKSLIVSNLNPSSTVQVIAAVWAGLLEHHPELDGFIDYNGRPEAKLQATLRQIEDWMSADNAYMKVIEVIFGGTKDAQPTGDGKKSMSQPTQ